MAMLRGSEHKRSHRSPPQENKDEHHGGDRSLFAKIGTTPVSKATMRTPGFDEKGSNLVRDSQGPLESQRSSHFADGDNSAAVIREGRFIDLTQAKYYERQVSVTQNKGIYFDSFQNCNSD